MFLELHLSENDEKIMLNINRIQSVYQFQTYEETGKKVAEKALDGYIYKGKTLREWIDILEQTQWIPVSERLPKASEYVDNVAKHYLVQNEYGDMLVARYIHSGIWEQMYQFQPIGDEIVAWMELPEKYRGE